MQSAQHQQKTINNQQKNHTNIVIRDPKGSVSIDLKKLKFTDLRGNGCKQEVRGCRFKRESLKQAAE